VRISNRRTRAFNDIYVSLIIIRRLRTNRARGFRLLRPYQNGTNETFVLKTTDPWSPHPDGPRTTDAKYFMTGRVQRDVIRNARNGGYRKTDGVLANLRSCRVVSKTRFRRFRNGCFLTPFETRPVSGTKGKRLENFSSGETRTSSFPPGRRRL